MDILIEQTMYGMLIILIGYPGIKDFIGEGNYRLMVGIAKTYERKEIEKTKKAKPIKTPSNKPKLINIKGKDNDKT